MKLYSIRDIVAGVFNGLYMFSNDAVASRWFFAICDADDQVAAFKKDMQLFRVGEMDQDTGFISPENPVLIVKGADNGISE